MNKNLKNMELEIEEIVGIVVLVIVFLFVVLKAVWLMIRYLKECQNQNNNELV